jgi:hypothetical protein
MFLVPNSWGCPLAEANPCHNPPGAGGGQFCSKKSGATAQAVTSNPAFQKWFAGSKIVGADGAPVVMYHGTPSAGRHSNNRYVRMEQANDAFPLIDAFNTDSSGITDGQWLGTGTYFTDDPDFAHEFGDRLMPVYLSVKNPFVVDQEVMNTGGLESRFEFLQQLQSLEGLPGDLKLDLQMPERREVHGGGDTYWVKYEMAPTTLEDGTKGYALLSRREGGPYDRPGTGGVDATGSSPAQVLFKHKYKYATSGLNKGLFNSTVITDIIGPGKFRDLLVRNGYDGVVERGRNGGFQEVVVFKPTQVKSAIGNRGTFSAHQPSIMEAGVL